MMVYRFQVRFFDIHHCPRYTQQDNGTYRFSIKNLDDDHNDYIFRWIQLLDISILGQFWHNFIHISIDDFAILNLEYFYI